MNKSTGDPVVRDTFIPVDLETSYLHLRTNSATGGGDNSETWYYNDVGLYAGGIDIWFTSTVKFRLLACQFYKPFPLPVPSEQDKHWVIEKRGYRTVILCNGQLVLDITASSKTCDDPEYADTWATHWGRKVTSIKFPPGRDSATKMYFVG